MVGYPARVSASGPDVGQYRDDSFTRQGYASSDLGKRARACRWATGVLGVYVSEDRHLPDAYGIQLAGLLILAGTDDVPTGEQPA